MTVCGDSPFAIGLVATEQLSPSVRCLTNAIGAGRTINLTRFWQVCWIGGAAGFGLRECPPVECGGRLV